MIVTKSFHWVKGVFDMRCSRAQRKLEAYLGGEVGERERERLEPHLAKCPECARALERARQLRAVLRGVQAPELPAGFHARLMARAAEQSAGPVSAGLLGRLRWLPSMPVPLRVGAVGAVIVAVGTGVLIGRDMWQLKEPSPSQQARLAAVDPVSIYRIDYLGEAPDGSLAGAYLSLMSGGAKR
jgi:anti-sigma factor (TIGR02949 family)